jgi:signal transduction histidine kinase
MPLYEFLMSNQTEILAETERKTRDLAGIRPSSDQLKRGLPIFYQLLVKVLLLEKNTKSALIPDRAGMAIGAEKNDEQAIAEASGRPNDAALAAAAGLHGEELLRLGYTLSHVVHAYGAICQAITEMATERNVGISSRDFKDLNRCLDIAIAGAVTGYQSHRNIQEVKRENEHVGFLAHELRNALSTINISLQLIRRGTVGFSGSTGHVLDQGLKRIATLIDRSLMEVRLNVDPYIHVETINLLQLVDQICVTAEIQAQSKSQIIELQIDPTLVVKADQELFYSALSNIIQNALKYTRTHGKVLARGESVGKQLIIEVEDECGGLSSVVTSDLFEPFQQRHENREGLGLGLTIAQRAITLNRGTIDVVNLPGKGCIFRITLPQ